MTPLWCTSSVFDGASAVSGPIRTCFLSSQRSEKSREFAVLKAPGKTRGPLRVGNTLCIKGRVLITLRVGSHGREHIMHKGACADYVTCFLSSQRNEKSQEFAVLKVPGKKRGPAEWGTRYGVFKNRSARQA